jgi:predicted membrane protein
MTMKMTELREPPKRYPLQPQPAMFYSGVARLFSLMLAILLSLWLILYPQSIITDGQAPSHWLLLLCMWGIAGGFVHGVGYVPRKPVLRIALGPLVAWLLMLGAMVLILG